MFAEDKLFATLDPTSRAITLDDNRQIIVIDTVGFIRKLPHHLIEAFKSTLEEAALADVLLHVIDASNPEADNQVKVVEQVLDEIGAGEKPVVAVFNKCDLTMGKASATPRANKSVYISARYGKQIDTLIDAIARTAPGRKRRVRVCIPYSEGSLVNQLHDTQKVDSESYGDKGTVMDLRVDAETYEKIRKYLI